VLGWIFETVIAVKCEKKLSRNSCNFVVFEKLTHAYYLQIELETMLLPIIILILSHSFSWVHVDFTRTNYWRNDSQLKFYKPFLKNFRVLNARQTRPLDKTCGQIVCFYAFSICFVLNRKMEMEMVTITESHRWMIQDINRTIGKRKAQF
jgi:hypothetical protein